MCFLGQMYGDFLLSAREEKQDLVLICELNCCLSVLHMERGEDWHMKDNVDNSSEALKLY